MPGHTITVTRGGGQLQPVSIKDPAFDAVCRQAMAKAQDLAVSGCPFGDAIPPKCVEVHDGSGALVIRIVVDA